MTFAIISPTRVEVDGKDAGLLYDFIRDNPGNATEIKAALVEWHAGHVRTDQARDAEVQAAKAAAMAEVAAKEAEHAAAVSALQADIAALGGKEQADENRKEQERQAILAQRAELDAKLAALDGEPLPADAKEG